MWAIESRQARFLVHNAAAQIVMLVVADRFHHSTDRHRRGAKSFRYIAISVLTAVAPQKFGDIFPRNRIVHDLPDVQLLTTP